MCIPGKKNEKTASQVTKGNVLSVYISFNLVNLILLQKETMTLEEAMFS